MKRAYSLKHGRIINAADVAYEDCRDDRITCEICGERVFKVQANIRASERHYLSHYRKKPHVRECEARVAARIASELKASVHCSSHGQDLASRVTALGRIFGTQFPSVAKLSNGMGLRERSEKQIKNGMILPSVLTTHHSLHAIQFQLVAKRNGTRIEIRDLVTPDIEIDFPEAEKGTSNKMLAALRRTLDGNSQSTLGREIIPLICMAESRNALYLLARHAYADIVVNGTTWDDPRAPVLHKMMSKMAQGTRIDKMKPHMRDALPGKSPDPSMPNQSFTWYDIIRVSVVARMHDVLNEINVSIPVPPRGMHEAILPRVLQASEQAYQRAIEKKDALTSVCSSVVQQLGKPTSSMINKG